MTTRDPLTVRCPRCGSNPGERCRNYRGNPCAPHADRIDRARAGLPPADLDAVGQLKLPFPESPDGS